MSLKSQISEKAYLKTIKVMKLLKSVSGPSLSDKNQHKRSNTSNKPEGKIFTIPEERSGSKKTGHLHTESHPNSKLKNPSFSKSISSSLDQPNPLETIKSNYKVFSHKSHDRALSSRVYKLSNSPIPELRFPSLSEYPEIFFRKSEELSKILTNECLHWGHKNSVNSIAFLQGRTFTAGSDYNIISWPRLDPIYQLRNQKINPLAIHQAHSRRINTLETIGGNILISAGRQRKIKIWSLSRELNFAGNLDTLEKNTNSILAASQRTLLSGGSEGIIKIWDVETRILAKKYPEHKKPINSIISLSPSTFLCGADDGFIKLCDIRASRSISSYFHNSPVTSILKWDDNCFYSGSNMIRVRNR